MRNLLEHTTLDSSLNPEQRSRRSRYFDIALALGLTLITWGQLFVASFATKSIINLGGDFAESVVITGFHQRSILVSLALAACCFMPLIWRRNKPLLVLAIVTLAQCATTLWTRDPLLTFLAPLIALYTVGTLVSTRRLIAATTAVLLLLLAANQLVPMVRLGGGVRQRMTSEGRAGQSMSTEGIILLDSRQETSEQFMPGPSDDSRHPSLSVPSRGALSFINLSRGSSFVGVLQIVASVVAFAALGRMTRLRREYIAEAEARALEERHAREEEALRRAEEERLNIARELHDITAHSLAAVIVQAGAAEALVQQGDITAAQESIVLLRETAKRSLDELRHVVGVLRESQLNTNAPLAPEVSLKDLDSLIFSFRTSELPVELDLSEEGRSVTALPKTVDIAVYRVIQESLTNVLRHAKDPSEVIVRLKLQETLLSVEVFDNGTSQDDEKDGGVRPDQDVSPSHGIAGMRERVLALGGSFEAGKQQGGFRVWVEVPL